MVDKSRYTAFFTTADVAYCDWCVIIVVQVVGYVKIMLLQSQIVILVCCEKGCEKCSFPRILVWFRLDMKCEKRNSGF